MNSKISIVNLKFATVPHFFDIFGPHGNGGLAVKSFYFDRKI